MVGGAKFGGGMEWRATIIVPQSGGGMRLGERFASRNRLWWWLSVCQSPRSVDQAALELQA